MQWYRWLALVSLIICVSACLWHLFRLIRLGKPVDLSKPAGEVYPAVRFAFTGAMSPARKESAYLHLPTYFAGLIYHFGTFLSIFLFFALLSGFSPTGMIKVLISGALIGTGISGAGIFIRRIVRKRIRLLSNPDDYISNLLVTGFHFISAFVLLAPGWLPAYFILSSLLMLYVPAGKLKHTVYFFAARYHLGYFYGWRGVWPPGKLNA